MKRALLYTQSNRTGVEDIRDYQPVIHCYADADWGGDPDTRRSTTGYIIKLDGNTIGWGTKQQHATGLSTAEAEYYALTEAAKEALWLRQFMSEILDRQIDTIPTAILYTDNQAAQVLTSNDQFHTRMKHVDIRYHFVREAVESKTIKIEWIPTEEQQADVLTKSVSRVTFDYLTSKIMQAQ